LGQKNGRARIWAKTGTRPRLPADQRYTNAYLFGAICPMAAKGAALMLPFANTRAMQMHLDEISCNVAAKAHAVVLMDRAGWHSSDKLKVPKNLSIILLPSRSPELNPVENIWQYLRQNWLSNRVFEDYDAIVEAFASGLGRTNTNWELFEVIVPLVVLIVLLSGVGPVEERAVLEQVLRPLGQGPDAPALMIDPALDGLHGILLCGE
jgi:hypothetical protein